jgi:hypothetical protein
MGRTEELTAATFRFDAFELDLQRRTLRRSGADVDCGRWPSTRSDSWCATRAAS